MPEPVDSAYIDELVQKASKFYNYDQQLTGHDRSVIFSEYRKLYYGQYIAAGLGLAVGITLPKRLFASKAGLADGIGPFSRTPYKSSYSSLLGLVLTLTSYITVARMQPSDREGNSLRQGIYDCLAGTPTVVGYTYYGETMRRPSSSMPDPEKMRRYWEKREYPSFPLVLVFYGQYNKDFGTANRVGATAREGGSASPQSSEGLYTDGQATELNRPQSTWDVIRQQHDIKNDRDARRAEFEWTPQQVGKSIHERDQSQTKGNKDDEDPF
ncbi:hypothetical protein DV453_003593 [Geotrichum candidum]|nr:hypothetical protein DV453_003593 [Geotrichum candidum]